ncbi:MAG: DUF192 domain-containing protein [Anaeromyxobacteraceae bacterium]
MKERWQVPRSDITRGALFALIAAAALATGPACASPGGPRVVLESGGKSHVVKVELADTDPKRERGLMFRKELPDGQGMLFLFDEEREHTFWMKDTLIPLDMIFVDGAGRVTTIVANARPLTLEPRTGGPARMVLEVPGGWAREHDVRVGDRMRVEGLPPGRQ